LATGICSGVLRALHSYEGCTNVDPTSRQQCRTATGEAQSLKPSDMIGQPSMVPCRGFTTGQEQVDMILRGAAERRWRLRSTTHHPQCSARWDIAKVVE